MELSNYRPIPVSYISFNISVRLMNIIFIQFLDKYNLLNKYIFVFRKYAHYALITLVDDNSIIRYFDLCIP